MHKHVKPLVTSPIHAPGPCDWLDFALFTLVIAFWV